MSSSPLRSALLLVALGALAAASFVAAQEVAVVKANDALQDSNTLLLQAQHEVQQGGDSAEPVVYHVRFASAFLASISMILVSEFGDKTFFIAAILAMRNNRWEVFAAAISALALMTVLSAGMGLTLPAILDPKITHYMATLLFFFFGAKLLWDAWGMEAGGDLKEELEEVEEELKTKELEESVGLTGAKTTVGGVEMANINGSAPGGMSPSAAAAKLQQATRQASANFTRFFRRFFSKVFLTCFSMTFLAEWGDRSQIATIALAAQKDALGVTAGGIVGHALCTGVAVLGGKLLATRVSERTISFIGGFLFLTFGVHSLYFGAEL